MSYFVNKPVGGKIVKFSSSGQLLGYAAGQHANHLVTLTVYWRSSSLISDYLYQFRHIHGCSLVQAVSKPEGSGSKDALLQDITAAVLDCETDRALKQVVDELREGVSQQIANFSPWPPEITEALQQAGGIPVR